MSGGLSVEQYLEAHAAERLGSLAKLVASPSVASQSEHAEDCLRTARAIAADLAGAGLENIEVSHTGGQPVVYPDWLHAPAAPTVLVYAHYDVQPAGDLADWRQPPYELTVKDGRIFGRGAADDKGQLHLHIRAVEALLATNGSLSVNIRFLFDGEEEIGSPHLEPWIAANRDRLRADLVVISDTGFLEGNRPAITIGLRGIMAATIDVFGPSVDLHSGAHGGAVQNPALALAAIVASLREPNGRVSIPGFYDDVMSGGRTDRGSDVPFDEAAYRDQVGVERLVGEPEFSVWDRRTARPTLDVHSLCSGPPDGMRTIIPSHAQATLSCRLVPDQDPRRIYELLADRVLSVAPPGVRVSVGLFATARASVVDIDHPAVCAASRAVEGAFGVRPLLVRDRGSIPACSILRSSLDVPVILVGFTNPDDNAHAPNEALVLDNYERGIRAVCRLWDELAGSVPAVGSEGADVPAAVASTGER